MGKEDEPHKPLLGTAKASKYEGISAATSSTTLDNSFSSNRQSCYGGVSLSAGNSKSLLQPSYDSQDTFFNSFDDGDINNGELLGAKLSNKVHQQTIDDLTEDFQPLKIEGLIEYSLGHFVYNVLGIATLGLTFLLGRWFSTLTLSFTTCSSPLCQASKIKIVNQFGEVDFVPINLIDYRGQYSQLFSKNFEGPEGSDIKLEDPVIPIVHSFQYRFITFVLDPKAGIFRPLGNWKDFRWINPELCHNGLDTSTFRERKAIFDKNVIDIPAKPITRLLLDEILHPFNVFQIFSMILWCFEQYHIYAASILIISSISIATTLIQTQSNWKQIQDMSRFVCEVSVLRDEKWSSISSSELVPGDVYDLQTANFTIFPCDSILLQGDCIVSESMLTGESIPVSKVPLSEPHHLQDLGPVGMGHLSPELARSLLFSGTQIIRARPGHSQFVNDRRVTAMVLRTGFNTTKGSLVRSILFPRPNMFKFYRDSFYFIGVMALIALVGFVDTVFTLINLGMSTYLIVVRALDLITIVVPPALPATMSVGMSFSIARLRESGIFCIAPSRINVGGKVNAVCFDKTGTLTEEGLDVLGAHKAEGGKFLDLEPKLSGLLSTEETPLSLLHCLTTCHSIKVVNGELLGDPLDLRMFEATGWTVEEGGCTHAAEPSPEDKRHSAQLIPSMVRPPHQRRLSLESLNDIPSSDYTELAILRSFEFSSSLRRMSVVVRRWRSTTTEIYSKGAPEAMVSLCDPDSLPADYHQQLHAYTQHGYRVLACAGKSESNLSWLKVQRATRAQIESGLVFLGFLVFENKLKPGTIPAIQVLKEANIRQIMCTGDNHLTAISVAKECGIMEENTIVYVPHIESDSEKIVWSAANRPDLQHLDAVTLSVPGPYSLAMTGAVFRLLIDTYPKSVIHRALIKTQVYARMSPDEKQELVELLQSIDYCVGFCGDGANDCGALKAADVGISLSDAEASVAAPFTSKGPDIGCVPLVIREGRAALVTSFSCFKYMGLYSIIQFASIALLYNYGSNLGDYQFLLIDLFIILPVAVAMGRTHPHTKLYPKPPTASLVSKRVLISFIGQCALQTLFQIGVYLYLKSQLWFEPPLFEPDDPNIASMVNTTLFHISSYQYLWGAIVFSVGYPYRKPLSSNIIFVFTLSFLLIFLLWMQLLVPFRSFVWVTDILELVPLPLYFHYILIVISLFNLIVSYYYEQMVVPILARFLKLIWFPDFRSQGKASKKLFKRVSQEMSANNP